MLAGSVAQASGATFNIGTGRETRIGDLANIINEIAGNKAGCQYLPRRSWDRINRRLACIDRARTVLGYEPAISLRQGLASTSHWFERVIPSPERREASAV